MADLWPPMTLLCLTTGKTYQICTQLGPTFKQNVLFQVGIYCEQFQPDQIKKGRPAATFDFIMQNNWKTGPP